MRKWVLKKEENKVEPQDGEEPKNEPHNDDDDDCEDAYPQEGECVVPNFVVRLP